MAISVIREMTEDDERRITMAAEKFLARHGLPQSGAALQDVEGALSEHTDHNDWQYDDYQRLRQLWLAAFRRAVRHSSADTCEYGCIGWSVN